MGQRVILVDDLDGSESEVTTVRFAANGTSCEIDLNAKNVEKFNKALAPFIAAARTVDSPAPVRAARTTSKRRSSGATAAGVEPAAVRVWAAENDIEVSPRGRIPAPIIEQYKAATGQ